MTSATSELHYCEIIELDWRVTAATDRPVIFRTIASLGRERTQLSPEPLLSLHQTSAAGLTAGPFPDLVLRDATFGGKILNTTGEINIAVQVCTGEPAVTSAVLHNSCPAG